MSTGTVEGQLVSFDVQPGLVVAQVQGSRKAPYVANVQFASLSDEQWRGVQREIEATLQFSARLLGGEVPAELEDVFERAGVSRLPRRWETWARPARVPTGRFRASTSRRCCMSWPTVSTTTPGCC